MGITVDEKELREILELTPCEQNIMIAGKHGIGKSVIIKKFFEAKGKKVVICFCSQAADAGDIIGLPRFNEETGKTEFALPWWFPNDDQPVVLFLDELNRARPEILQVVMDLTLNRKLAGKSLPAGSQIISAINDGDEYQLTDMDPALVSRFNLYTFAPTASDWVRWATSAGLDARVISFISTNTKFLDPILKDDEESLDKTPDRRAWERVSDIMKNIPAVNSKNLALKKLICGIVGSAAGVSFFETVAKNSLITPEDLLNDFNACRSLLSGYSLQEYVGLNDNLCSYIDASLGDLSDDTQQKVYAKNLNEYFLYLLDKKKGNREAFAHFINNYETGSYANLNFLVAMNSSTLESTITDFITSTKTI
jgi:hypothetical protein